MMMNNTEQDKIVQEYQNKIDYFLLSKDTNLFINLSQLNQSLKKLIYPNFLSLLYYLECLDLELISPKKYMIKIEIGRFTYTWYLNPYVLSNLYRCLKETIAGQVQDKWINSFFNWEDFVSIEFIKVY